jgi:hypothetical protein
LQKIQIVAVVHCVHCPQFTRCQIARFKFDHVMASVNGGLQQDVGSLRHLLCFGNATLEQPQARRVRAMRVTEKGFHAQRATQSRMISGLIFSPCPGFSGAVMMPFTGRAQSTQMSSMKPMFSRINPFGMEAMS